MAEPLPAIWPELLGKHWTFAECIHSNTGIKLGLDNTPPIELYPNAMRLMSLAESVRSYLWKTFDQEIHLDTDSAYRSLRVNVAVGGSGAHPGEKLSAHTKFLAMDIVPREISVTDMFSALRKSGQTFDKLIWETNGATAWCHLQAAPPGQVARMLVFTGVKGPNGSRFRSA